MRSSLLIVLCVLAQGSTAFAADPAGVAFFEAKIRPVLIKHCYECHSVETKALKGGLLVDSAVGLMTGGDSGPSVVPGKPEDSLLLQAMRFEGYEMPPAGRLSEDVLKDFERWISMGAPDPRQESFASPTGKTGIDLEGGRQFWAFQPAESHATPDVADQAWPKTWIDHYVLEKQERQGLAPSPDADWGTLLRRLSYDLTGLQPTPAEVARYLESPREQAWEQAVDRLLESPHFGEHWGRHWLDVARYADSNGGDFNATFHEAWRYRNYVIEAYNEDRPLPELILEQIAGDLLPADNDAERERQLVATGFLMLGTKMLSERDKEKLRMDVVDEQVSAIGSAFLGMTLGCARCHDHKFDPIPTKDYYALAGILRSTQTLDGEIQKYVSNWVRQPLPIKPEHAAALQVYEERSIDLKKRIKRAEAAVKQQAAQIARTSIFQLGTVVDDTAAEQIGAWKSSTFSKDFIGAGYVHDDRMEKGQKKIIFRAKLPADGKYEVRLAYAGSAGRATNVPVTIQHADGETQLSLDQSQPAPLERLLKPVGTFSFVKDREAIVTISNEGTDGYVMADAVQFVTEDDLKKAASVENPEAKAEAARLKDELTALQKDLKTLEATAPSPAPLALAVNDAPQLGDCNICIRGEPDKLGPKVPRGFLSVASFDEAPSIPAGESGRLELARWVADARNPLTARVYVNRVWHHLLGAGLVRSVDNFGSLGDRPTHPELLDQLAVEFVSHNWSTKWLVRQIVLSHVYQLSSDHDESRWQVDPENKLLWRAHRKRISAESIRDSILLAADVLSPESGGSPVNGLGTLVTQNRADDTGYSQTASSTRTLYQPVIRNELPALMRVFDFADPDFVTGERARTNVPAQALWMLNGDFVAQHAALVVARAGAAGPQNETAFLNQLYVMTLGRPPLYQEMEVAQNYLQQASADAASQEAAWRELVHAIFASSSFRMLD